MTTVTPAQCYACSRLVRDPLNPVAARCSAYPGAIPDDIAVYGADHRTPRGDERGGLVFAQADGDPAAFAFESWQQFAAVDPADVEMDDDSHALRTALAHIDDERGSAPAPGEAP